MLIPVVILLLFGLIEQLSAIECFTCLEKDFHCPVPYNLDADDESNENTVAVASYDSGFACTSDNSWDPRHGVEKLIVRGIAVCNEINEDNHRVRCCYTDYCNKQLPELTKTTLKDLEPIKSTETSNSQHLLASILSIAMTLTFQYFV